MAIRTYLTPDEYDALERATQKYGVRLRYLVRDAVLEWLRNPQTGFQPPEKEPDEPHREVNVLVDGIVYKALKEKSIAGSFHMREGLREAILQWLVLDAAGQAVVPTSEGDAAWKGRRSVLDLMYGGIVMAKRRSDIP
jgi:hypothetical protein